MRQSLLEKALKLGSAVFPPALFMPGFTSKMAEETLVRTYPLSQQDRIALEEISFGWLPAEVTLDLSLVHTQTISLPRAVARQAADAIKLYLRQKMPAQAEGLLWTYKQSGRVGDQYEYEVFVCKKALVDEILETASKTNGRIRNIRIDGVKKPLFEAKATTDKPIRAWVYMMVFTLISVFLLFTAFINYRTSELTLDIKRISENVQKLEQDALQARDNADSKDETLQSIQSDLSYFSIDSNRLEFLSNLAFSLSSDTWITEISIQSDTVHLSGFSSGEVSIVIDNIEEIDDVKSVQLDGPIMFDSFSNQNRFSLIAMLKVETP